MPKTDLVPCFYWGQDSQNDEPAKTMLRSEVRELKKQNRGFFVNHGNAFLLSEETPYSYPQPGCDLLESSGPSEPCISFAEMQANVGIVRDGVKNERGLIYMARTKVLWYPHITTFPELASGRWAQLA